MLEAVKPINSGGSGDSPDPGLKTDLEKGKLAFKEKKWKEAIDHFKAAKPTTKKGKAEKQRGYAVALYFQKNASLKEKNKDSYELEEEYELVVKELEKAWKMKDKLSTKARDPAKYLAFIYKVSDAEDEMKDWAKAYLKENRSKKKQFNNELRSKKY